MKLTCVTATFNAIAAGRREQLIRCVNSVAQLKTEHEHLIYDGASTDGTVELLRELEKTTPGLKVVSEKDTGIYNALNKGVRDASGEWFYVIGCDDYICHPTTMDELLGEIDNCKYEQIVTPVMLHGEKVAFKDLKGIFQIYRGTPYCHQGVLMRTVLIRKHGGFDESYKICADYDLLLKIHRSAAPIKYTFSAYASYAADGASESFIHKTREEFCIVQNKHFGTTPEEFWRIRNESLMPWRVIAAHCFHKDFALRSGAWFMFNKHVRHDLRIILKPLIVFRRWVRSTIKP